LTQDPGERLRQAWQLPVDPELPDLTSQVGVEVFEGLRRSRDHLIWRVLAALGLRVTRHTPIEAVQAFVIEHQMYIAEQGAGRWQLHCRDFYVQVQEHVDETSVYLHVEAVVSKLFHHPHEGAHELEEQ